MRTTAAVMPARGSAGRRTWHLALVALLLAGAFSFAVAALAPSVAQAAGLTVDQCNGVGPDASGATTGMTCTATIVNTVKGTKTSSTTTLTRQCSLGPCPNGNGTFVTQSATSLVTRVQQCNGSDNDAAHPITCSVTITNIINGKVSGALPVTAATVNECVGSGNGGGGSVLCSPYPASTTGATVTQCNGSANGGGATVDCQVAPQSKVSPAIPITINQCNGTGNPGGSVVRCRTSLTTDVSGLTATTPTPTPTPKKTPRTPTGGQANTGGGTSGGGTSGQGTTGQVTTVPRGGVPAGNGSMAGLQHQRLLALGGILLLAAGGAGVLLVRRRVEAAQHLSR